MELNHMVPPPTSTVPETDGEDSCRVDVMELALDVVTLLICLCGLLGNGTVLWLLGCRLRRNAITVYVLNLAAADFTFLLFLATTSLLYISDNTSCSALIPLKYLRPLFLLSLFSYNMGLYLLATISIERCVSILWPSRCHRPQRLSVVVCVLLWALAISVIAAVTSLCLLHESEHCRLALISMYILNLLIFAPSMVISSTILFMKVQCGSQQHQPKRLSIGIFLLVLFYLLFALPLSIQNLLQQFNYTFLTSQVVFLLACINSSIKPLIYILLGCCQRHCSSVSLQVAFQRIFEELEGSIACSHDTMMDTLAPAC